MYNLFLKNNNFYLILTEYLSYDINVYFTFQHHLKDQKLLIFKDNS